jgi:hypothetical protein
MAVEVTPAQDCPAPARGTVPQARYDCWNESALPAFLSERRYGSVCRGLIQGLHRLGKRPSVFRVFQPRGERLAAAGSGKHSSGSLSSGGHPLGKVCLRAVQTAGKAATGPCRHCAFVGLCGTPLQVPPFGGDHLRTELSGLSHERGTARHVGVLCSVCGSASGSMLRRRMEARSLPAG